MGQCYKVLLAVVVCLHHVRAAERVDIQRHVQRVLEEHHLMSRSSFPRQPLSSKTLLLRELDEVTALGPDTSLEVTRTVQTVQGTRLIRMQEMFKGEPVFDGIVTVTTDQNEQHIFDASGTLYRNIEKDTNGFATYSAGQALEAALIYNSDQNFQNEIRNVKIESEIFLDKEGHAYPGYMVQYLILRDGEERRPTCIIDARNGYANICWDALDSRRKCSAKGTGGNLKTGKIHYGTLQECLNVTKFQGRCYAKNKYVRVLNNRGFLPEKFTSNITASYDCKEATDAVNGAYSPMLDALFYGTVIGRMFEEWYNMTPLSDQMQFRVHFGKKVSNAYWNGNECQFGDGDDEAYPFVTVDLVGHEVAHGITEQNSELLYFQESGGINEAFSDICGETAEAYLSEADWVVGAEIMKGDTPMRFFENPEDNNESISHVRDFTDNMDPHDSSGVYNRVFYVLVNDFNIPIKNAFHAFLHANQMYWHHMTTFASGACDVLKAAYDLGQNVTAFRQAFEYVGINFDTCNIDSHVLELRNDDLYENITVSQDSTPMFTFAVPGEYAGIVTVNATSSSGDVTITLTDYDTESDELSIYSDGLNFVEYDVLEYSHIIFGIILTTSSETPLTDVTMVATFGCRTDFLLPEDSPLFAWKKKLWSDNCS